jgi:hypothetical protein
MSEREIPSRELVEKLMKLGPEKVVDGHELCPQCWGCYFKPRDFVDLLEREREWFELLMGSEPRKLATELAGSERDTR